MADNVEKLWGKNISLDLMVDESEDLMVEERMVHKTDKRRKQCILDTIMSNDKQILQSKCLKEHEVEIIAVNQGRMSTRLFQ